MKKQFYEYIRDVIAVPNENFGGLPICPYAATAKIDYVSTADISIDKLKLIISECLDEVLIILIDIDISPSKLEAIASELNDGCVEVFAGHPESNYEFNGVCTRRDPQANLQVNRVDALVDARKKLAATKYYLS